MMKRYSGEPPGLHGFWREWLPLGLFCLVLAVLRYGVIERGLLADCNSGLVCGLGWLLVQSFQAERLGICALVLGVVGFLVGSRLCGRVALFVGVAGLMLYNPDYAAPGALLGLLTGARTQEFPPGVR